MQQIGVDTAEIGLPISFCDMRGSTNELQPSCAVKIPCAVRQAPSFRKAVVAFYPSIRAHDRLDALLSCSSFSSFVRALGLDEKRKPKMYRTTTLPRLYLLQSGRPRQEKNRCKIFPVAASRPEDGARPEGLFHQRRSLGSKCWSPSLWQQWIVSGKSRSFFPFFLSLLFQDGNSSFLSEL